MQRQEDNIQMELNDIGMRVLFESAGANRIQWQPFVNMIMNPGFHKRQGMWRGLVWPMCACIPTARRHISEAWSSVFTVLRTSYLTGRFLPIWVIVSSSGHGFVELIILTCGSVSLLKIIEYNFDYPSPDYPSVPISQVGGEPLCVVGVGGNAHTLLITWSYRRDNFCLQT
jgi:hypothetical protein